MLQKNMNILNVVNPRPISVKAIPEAKLAVLNSVLCRNHSIDLQTINTSHRTINILPHIHTRYTSQVPETKIDETGMNVLGSKISTPGEYQNIGMLRLQEPRASHFVTDQEVIKLSRDSVWCGARPTSVHSHLISDNGDNTSGSRSTSFTIDRSSASTRRHLVGHEMTSEDLYSIIAATNLEKTTVRALSTSSKRKSKSRKKRKSRGKIKLGSSNNYKKDTSQQFCIHDNTPASLPSAAGSLNLQAQCMPVHDSLLKVTKAKVFHINKMGSSLQKADKPDVDLSKSQQVSEDNVASKAQVKCNTEPTTGSNTTKPGTRHVLQGSSTDHTRTIKVYCSEKQSGSLKEMGLEFPCAPPATPTPELERIYEYVPSMADIRSQRTVKLRLELLEKAEKSKQNKLKENRLKQEKIQVGEQKKLLKRQQRLEIYALNKMMTQLEESCFKQFINKKGLS